MVAKRKTKKKSAVKKKATDEKVKIKALGKSRLVDEDLKRMELKAPIKKESKKKLPAFYKNFTFECGHCIEEFEHTTLVKEIKKRVVCPKCKKIHVIKIIPASKYFHIEFPESIKVVNKK